MLLKLLKPYIYFSLVLLISCSTDGLIDLEPAGSFSISDSSGEWFPSRKLVNGERGSVTFNKCNNGVSVSLRVNFYSLSREPGSFLIHYCGTDIMSSLPPEVFDSDQFSNILYSRALLSREKNSNRYSWSTQSNDHMQLVIDEVVNFQDNFYVSGRVYSYFCNLDSRPVCQTVEGTFINAKVQYID